MNAAPNIGQPTLGVYVQVPFCASKCSFCNFSSSVERSATIDRYAGALRAELANYRRFFADCGIPPDILSHPVDSVYVGGGTPTLLGEERLTFLLRSLQQHFSWDHEDVEFTLETTPGSADGALLRVLRGAEANRLSIGAQTFVDRELGVVGRLHSADDTCELVRQARNASFQNISLDLIAGLPHQTKESFRYSLELTARLQPEHISLYLFEVDEKSRLGGEVVHGGNRYHADAAPGDEFMADAYEFGCEFLRREGYVQYEISNFARPGFESRHNRKYWQLAPYVGLGAGAHSFDGVRRWSNEIDVRTYLAKIEAQQPAISDCRTLTTEEQVDEFFFVGLRQTQGINLEWARARWGADCLKPWENKVQDLAHQGWLVLQSDRVSLARHTYLISNEIFQEFLSLSPITLVDGKFGPG